MSGKSMWHAVLENAPSPRSELAVETGKGSFYRRGEWKLIMADEGKQLLEVEGWRWPKPTADQPTWDQYFDAQFLQAQELHPVTHLFNVKEDPGENTPAINATMVQEMRAAMKLFLAGRKRTARWNDCPNAECAQLKQAAHDKVLKSAAELASSIKPCMRDQALRPY